MLQREFTFERTASYG